jgi:hypothetical protein
MSWKDIVKSRTYFTRPASIEEGGNEPNPKTKEDYALEQMYNMLEKIQTTIAVVRTIPSNPDNIAYLKYLKDAESELKKLIRRKEK